MIVPQYWAEARLQHRAQRRQITVRRSGWSDESQAAAQVHAETRAREALDRLISGERLPRFEHREAYNGADGVPIREEIVERHGEDVVTRNSYGALCLNTPDVLFADIDFVDNGPSLSLRRWVYRPLILLAVLSGLLRESWRDGVVATLAAMVLAWWISRLIHRWQWRQHGGPEGRALARIDHFLSSRHDWRLRRYRTPAGLRLLAVHRTFEPNEPDVTTCFEALGADPVFALMCQRQHCFRARVSPKPWRIGIAAHLRPRPGVWPIADERLPLRRRWVAEYEQVARGYAACRFEGEHGTGQVDPRADEVRRLHDALCQAERELPIA